MWGVRNRWRDVGVQFTEAESQGWTQDMQGAVGSLKVPPTSCRNLKGLPVAPFDRWEAEVMRSREQQGSFSLKCSEQLIEEDPCGENSCLSGTRRPT